MAKEFVRYKSRGAFTALVRQLPVEWQPKVQSLLESVLFRNEISDYVAGSGDLVSHSDLDNLDSDDHLQYHTEGRADTWFTTKDVADLSGKSHTSLTDIGVNTHPAIDTHLAHNTGHPNQVVNSTEPADGTLAITEGAFWYELV